MTTEPFIRAMNMPKNERSKIHHYIPQALQVPFTIEGENRKIWFAEKDVKTGIYGRPEQRNISSTFKERDLYTINYDGSPSDIIERKHYGPIDNDFSAVISQIIDVLNRGAIPRIDKDGEYYLTLVTMEMMKRTPSAIFDIDLDPALEEILENIDESDLNNKEVDKFISSLEDEKFKKKFIKESLAVGRIKPLPKVGEQLKNFSVRWAVSEGKHSFLLSSRYCYMIGNGGSGGLINQNVEIWMPITPKYCMVLVRDPYKRIPHICSVDTKKVRKFNNYSADRSSAIASHSQKLIECITEKKAIIR